MKVWHGGKPIGVLETGKPKAWKGPWPWPEKAGAKKPGSKKTGSKKTSVAASDVMAVWKTKSRPKPKKPGKPSHLRLKLVPRWESRLVRKSDKYDSGPGGLTEPLERRRKVEVAFPRSVLRKLERETARLAHQGRLRRGRTRKKRDEALAAVAVALVEFALEVRGVY